MIANENQYQVTREWERDFAQLVEYMESAEADTTPRDSPVLRRAKLEAARSTLDELRQELRDWESRHTVDWTSPGNSTSSKEKLPTSEPSEQLKRPHQAANIEKQVRE